MHSSLVDGSARTNSKLRGSVSISSAIDCQTGRKGMSRIVRVAARLTLHGVGTKYRSPAPGSTESKRRWYDPLCLPGA
eukprot:9502997-Pyramimonas_sp.AAC.1